MPLRVCLRRVRGDIPAHRDCGGNGPHDTRRGRSDLPVGQSVPRDRPRDHRTLADRLRLASSRERGRPSPRVPHLSGHPPLLVSGVSRMARLAGLRVSAAGRLRYQGHQVACCGFLNGADDRPGWKCCTSTPTSMRCASWTPRAWSSSSISGPPRTWLSGKSRFRSPLPRKVGTTPGAGSCSCVGGLRGLSAVSAVNDAVGGTSTLRLPPYSETPKGRGFAPVSARSRRAQFAEHTYRCCKCLSAAVSA